MNLYLTKSLFSVNILTMNMSFLNQKTPKEIIKSLADRMRGTRKNLKLTQQKLSEKSGVSLGSVKRFERTGDISLISLVKISIAMSCEGELDNLFATKTFHSLQEVIEDQ